MKLSNVDGFDFDFQGVLNAFVFDEKDKGKSTFHGAPMKAIDVLVETSESYVYIEIKDLHDIDQYDITSTDSVIEDKRKAFKWLKNYLKYKFRDTHLYRYAENKVAKPIHYVCLLNFDNALCNALKKQLQKELPVGKASKRWTCSLAESVQVVNLDRWEKAYPKWKVSKNP